MFHPPRLTAFSNLRGCFSSKTRSSARGEDEEGQGSRRSGG
jgi:hypothetical protein